MPVSKSLMLGVVVGAAVASLGAVGAIAGSAPALSPLPVAVQVAQAEATVLYEGSDWVKKSRKVQGAWRIIEEADGSMVLELADDFKTSGAPDLKIYLSTLSADEVASATAEAEGVLIAPLDSTRGAQRYDLPSDIDLADFQSLIIHCRQYTKLWAASPLSEAGQPS